MPENKPKSLSKFLHQRGLTTPPLTVEELEEGCKRYFEQHGKWPGQGTEESPREVGLPWNSWKAVDAACTKGMRGLPPLGSLRKFLSEKGLDAVTCTPEELEKACERYFEQHGKWPSQTSSESPREVGLSWNSWKAVDNALRQGLRGL